MCAFRIHRQDGQDPSAIAAPPSRGVFQMLLGVFMIALAIYGLYHDIAWIAQPFYAWVWWGYILFLDGYCIRKRGDSLLSTRIHCLFPICVWSITFWMFFELVNSRIRNWYYVGVYSAGELLAGALFTVLAFATVFMGIFQTHDALTATGLWRGWKKVPRHFSPRLTYVLQAIGLTMAALALVFPHYLAPLVWGSFTLLVDPWNYRRGTRSLLRDLETGDYGLLARLLLAGLLCGLVWEGLNFFAPQKWIYTVRGLEDFKLFEMPLLGFLGFPALALDSMAAFALFASFFLGNRTWERPGDLNYTLAIHPPQSAKTFWRSCLVHALFWAAVAQFGTPVNVASIQVEMRHLGLAPPEIRALADRGITRSRQLLRSTASTARLAELRDQLPWPAGRLSEVRDRAELYHFKGIGMHHGRLLESVGIRRPGDFRKWRPAQLHERLLEAAAERRSIGEYPPLRRDFVNVWVLSSKGLLTQHGD